ncbi:MAG: M15 family metallopeptidase [Carnobacterium sp.]|nr:M15 family metallopeptidase [Carnobacterium sp.]
MKKKTYNKKERQYKRKVRLLRSLLCIIFILIVSFLLLKSTREKKTIILNVSEEMEMESSMNKQDYVNNDISWKKTLVNRWNPIPQNYPLQVVKVKGGERVDKRIYEPLMKMLNSAKAEGFDPRVVSGYRTEDEQKAMMNEKVAVFQQQGYSYNEAKNHAEKWVAIPGTSEHELGLSVDINGVSYGIYQWLQENSYKYGFIFRYPDNKKEITGVEEEVWHYRYVGIDAAKDIYEGNISLEEYLGELNSK